MQSAQGPNDRQAAVLISLLVAGATAVITVATFWWIYSLALAPDLQAAAQAEAAPYDYTTGIQAIVNAEPNVPAEGDPREPWLGEEAWQIGIQAGQEYISDNPQPQNVQVLQDMSTAQIWAYMQRMSGAMGVSCQYCHDINNYAADPYPQKISGRLMLLLVRDLNAQYMANLPNWRGNFVQCDTCHNGLAKGMATVSQQFVGSTPPIDVYLEPLDENGVPQRDPIMNMGLKEASLYYLYNYQVWDPFDATDPDNDSGRGSLALTYDGGRTQDQVTINQSTMNLMGWSLGVGCTYCHNSRNFYAYEAEHDLPQFHEGYGVNRIKSQQMLLMTTFMAQNWNRYVLPDAAIQDGGDNVPENLPLNGRQYYLTIDETRYAMPGCYTCHQNNVVPKAAINAVDIPPGDEGTTVFPAVLRGLNGGGDAQE